MAPSILGSALSDSLWQAEQTPWGSTASAVSQAIPGLYNPQASNSRNFWMTLGGGILGTVLAGLGRNQADERNAELYTGFGALQAAKTQEERNAIVRQYPRLTNAAMTLQALDTSANRDLQNNIAMKKAEAQILMPLELERFRQQEGIRTANEKELLRMRLDAVYGQGQGNGMVNATGSPGRQEETEYNPVVQPMIPETAAQAYRRLRNQEGMSDGAARQEVKRIFGGDLSKIREQSSEKIELARKTTSAIERMTSALPQMNDETWVSTAAIPLRQLYASVRPDSADARALDALSKYQAASAELTSAAAQDLKGSLSDKDIIFAKERSAALSKTTSKQQAEAILKDLTPIQDRLLELQLSRDRWINTFKTSENFQQVWEMYVNENPKVRDGKIVSGVPSFWEWMKRQPGGDRVVMDVARNELESRQPPAAQQQVLPQADVLGSIDEQLRLIQEEKARRGL